jgi:benzaldehyde dehydrogenase (NAD)
MTDAIHQPIWLDPKAWEGRIYSSGWSLASETIDVLEPATGAKLGHVGLAHAKDVAEAAQVACGSQGAWAAMSYETRGTVLRAAAQLAEANRQLFVDWLMREGGSIRGKAEFEVSITIRHFIWPLQCLRKPAVSCCLRSPVA